MSDKYITIPVSYIPKIINPTEESYWEIYRYGIYYYANSKDFDLSDVATHLIFSYYQNMLPNVLKEMLESCDLEYLGWDDFYRGFDSNGRPQKEGEEYVEILELLETHQPIREKASRFFILCRACKSLDESSPSLDSQLNSFSELLESHKGEPHTTVKISQLREVIYEKNDKVRLQFATYLALRSIIGKKRFYLNLTYDFLLARLMGFSKFNDIPNREELDEPLKDIYDKYMTKSNVERSNCPNRRRRRRLLHDTCEYWSVNYYNDGTRGTAVALSGKNKPSYEELVLIVESRKQVNKKNLQKEKKQQAKEKALETLRKMRA